MLNLLLTNMKKNQIYVKNKNIMFIALRVLTTNILNLEVTMKYDLNSKLYT